MNVRLRLHLRRVWPWAPALALLAAPAMAQFSYTEGMRQRDAGVLQAQIAALAALANRGPMSPTALAEDQNVQGPPMSRIIGALVEAGLARREEHPTDGRQVVVSVTEAGMVEVTETRRRRNVWLEARLAELTPADRETLARAALLLDRIATQ